MTYSGRILAAAMLVVVSGGCGGSEGANSRPIMVEAEHSHYHVHAADASHGHAHPEDGDGHTHSHTHTPR